MDLVILDELGYLPFSQVGYWINVTELAEKVLCALPHDPVALACLTEVEHAHGHTDFAVTYLRHATEAMA